MNNPGSCSLEAWILDSVVDFCSVAEKASSLNASENSYFSSNTPYAYVDASSLEKSEEFSKLMTDMGLMAPTSSLIAFDKH